MFGKITKCHGSALIEVEIITLKLPVTMPTTSNGIENLDDGYTLAPGSTMIVTGTDKQYILGTDGTWEEYSTGGGGDLSAYQEKTLSSPVTIGAETATTVEGAIGAVADVIPNTAASGNKLVTAADINPWNTPEMHRMIFRGKNLGSSVSAAQLAAIRDGSFTDLYVGDYWENTVTINATIDGIAVSKTFTEKWRIADINYWLHCTHSETDFTKPHLVIVPDVSLYNAKMNDTPTTEGGYEGSKMRNPSGTAYTDGNLQYALDVINAAFPNMVLSHPEYLVNAVTNGKPSGCVWRDPSKVELMNENMVYGHEEFNPANDGSSNTLYRHTIDKTQLALFQIAPSFIVTHGNREKSQWLRDVSSSNSFCAIDYRGYSRTWQASNSHGVRPVFGIG